MLRHNRWEWRVGRPRVFCMHCICVVFSFLNFCHCQLSPALLLQFCCFWSAKTGFRLPDYLKPLQAGWSKSTAVRADYVGFHRYLIFCSFVLCLVQAWCLLRYMECIANKCGWGGGFVWTNQAQFDMIRWCFTWATRMDEIHFARVLRSVYIAFVVFLEYDNGCWYNGFPSIEALVRRAHVVVAIWLLSSVNTCCS